MWVAAAGVLAVGGLAVWRLYQWVHAVAVPVAVPVGRARVDSLDVIRTTLSAAAFVGALLAGLYAYRKQRLAEGDAARADAAQLAERYTKAAEQLGSEQAAIRLAGVYAMARLADDWRDQRQTCIDVLCAYLRMPYAPPSADDHRPGEEQVRSSIVRVIASRLQAHASPSWSPYNLDFTQAQLESVDFNVAMFGGETSFNGAIFSGSASFVGATFSRAGWFDQAVFSGAASFHSAVFVETAWFENATFASDAGFDRTRFGDSVTFRAADFREAAWFHASTFVGTADFTTTSFTDTPNLEDVIGAEQITGWLAPPSAP